tara:strand:- start:1555 stop:1692 length:138 start_codon:yes stop_codon:yes gene_type:complete
MDYNPSHQPKDSLLQLYHFRVEALQKRIECLEAQLEVNQQLNNDE